MMANGKMADDALSRDDMKAKERRYKRAKRVLNLLENLLGKYHERIFFITSICASISGFLLGLNVTVIKQALLAWIAAFIGFSVLLFLVLTLIANIIAKRFVKKYESDY